MLSFSKKKCPQVNATKPHWCLVSIGSGDGLVPSDKQAINWTNVDQVLYHHMASLGHSELTHCGLVMPYGNIDLCQHWLR